MKFFIVDVFGMDKYSGNQLAVVVLDRQIPCLEMQKIANEFHFSETTFIEKNSSFGNSVLEARPNHRFTVNRSQYRRQKLINQ